MRVRILGDSTGAEDAFKRVEKIANASADQIANSFNRLGDILKRSIGWATAGVALERGLDLASKQQSLQQVQSVLLQNQKVTQKSLIGNMVQIVGSNYKYSSLLDQQATTMSATTGIQKNQIIQAQNILLPNQDLVTLFEKQKGSLQNTVMAAANLSAVMGGGGGGSIVSSARLLSRTLADPAKSMASMRRFGVTLSKAEQARIKSLEQGGNLLAAQNQLLVDMNNHLKGAAQAALSPMERLSNDINLILQSLGQGLLPILDAMASAVAPIVTAFTPILQGIAQTISTISETIGTSLGTVFAALQPVVAVLSQGVLPAVLSVVAPIIEALGKIATIISNSFDTVAVASLVKIFTQLSESLVTAIAPALNAIVGSFNQMNNNGQLAIIMTGIAQAFQTMAPVLPQLVGAFAQLVVALTPLITATLPSLVKIINLWAQIMVSLTPVITGVVGWVTKLIKSLGGLAPVIGTILAVWFTRNLFLDPLRVAGDGVINLSSKVATLGRTMRGVSGTFKDFRALGGETTNPLTGATVPAASRSSRYLTALGQQAGRDRERRMRLAQELENRGKTDKAKAMMEKLSFSERRYQRMLGSYENAEGRGGGLKGLLKSIVGSTIGMASLPKNQLDATNMNTQAINNLTDSIGKLSGGFGPFGGGGGGGGGNPIKDAKNLYKDFKEAKNIEGDISEVSKLSKFGKLGSMVGKFSSVGGKVFGKLGAMKGKAVGLLKNFGKSAVTKIAETVGLRAGEVAAVEGASAALAPETLGLSEVVGNVALGLQTAWQYRKTIMKWGGKAVEFGKKLVSGGLKRVAGIATGAFHAAGSIVHGIGSFFGGLFGGGDKPKPSPMSMGHQSMWHMLFGGADRAVSGMKGKVMTAMATLGQIIYQGITSGIAGAGSAGAGILGLLGNSSLAKTLGANGGKVPKYHNGGIVGGMTGREVPAILQAGEAVLSVSQVRNMNRGGTGHSMIVSPNAVNITINGNADQQTVNLVKTHVEAQFKELHRTLKSMGR